MRENIEDIKKLYDSGKTYQQIADVYNVSKQRIHQVLKNYTTFRNQSIKKKMGIENCQICNISSDYSSLNLHHKDGNSSNNNTGNLQVVCARCHRIIHSSKPKEIIKEYTSNPDGTLTEKLDKPR